MSTGTNKSSGESRLCDELRSPLFEKKCHSCISCNSCLKNMSNKKIFCVILGRSRQLPQADAKLTTDNWILKTSLLSCFFSWFFFVWFPSAILHSAFWIVHWLHQATQIWIIRVIRRFLISQSFPFNLYLRACAPRTRALWHIAWFRQDLQEKHESPSDANMSVCLSVEKSPGDENLHLFPQK